MLSTEPTGRRWTSSYFPYLATKTQPFPAAFPLSPAQAAPPPFSLNPRVAAIVVAVPDLKLPRSYQWNVALEQSLGDNQTFSLTYLGAVGRNLLRVTSLFNPNPNFQFISLTDNSATSDYHALQAEFHRRLSRGLQLLASYTFAHSIDTASTDAFATYLNTPGSIANPKIDRGNSDFDIRHAFTAGLTYNLPLLRGSRLAKAVFGEWSLDGLFLASSAPPVDLIGAPFVGAGFELYPRLSVNPGAPLTLSGSGYPGGKIFNKAAFALAAPGHQGNFGRNVLRGFDAVQADIAVQRIFRITENVGLRLRGEFFNI